MVGSKSTDLFAHTTHQVASYISWTYHHGGDIHCVVETFTRPALPTPPVPHLLPTGGPDPVGQVIFQEQVKDFVKHTNKLEENIKSLWSLLFCGLINIIMTPSMSFFKPCQIHGRSL